MAVLGRLLVSSAERLDLPDLLSIDSYGAGDWKYFLKGIVGGDKPYILKGFDVIDPGNAIGTQSCSIRVADSIVFYPGSNSGSFFHGLEENHPQAAPLVPELRKNAVNYVYLTFSTFNTSVDTRAFWDPDKDGGVGGEFTQDINTESVLKVDVNVSTGSFPANTIPVAKITVGPVVITRIEDARDMMFRLGSGGINPNPFNTYGWRSLPSAGYEREEPPTQMLAGGVNPFQGADKNIYTLKEWMDAVMSKLRELGGTTYWYDDTSSFSIITNFYDAVATAFKSKGKWVHDTVTPGLLTWTEDIQIKMTSDPRTYIIRQGSKTLADEQVMYIPMERNLPLNPTDENVSWVNGVAYVNTVGGAVGLFTNLSKGDYIKKANDSIDKWVRVEEFYDAVNLGGSTTTAAGARSVRLGSLYLGVTGEEKGRYDKGVYLPAEVVVSDRDDAAIGNVGGNFHWLALRSDTIENVGNAVTTSLAVDIDQHDGQTARVTSVAHGLVDGDRVTIANTTNFDGTYKVEVETADIFYITVSGGPFGDESGDAYYATITTVARSTPYGFQEESANHGFNSDDTIMIDGTTNYDGSYQINVRNSTSFTIAVPGPAATETTGTATLARVIVRTEGAVAQIIQGQIIDIGGSVADNIRQYVGMDSLSQTAPNYSIPPSYNTLDGMQNYNGVVNENLTSRVSKLTAMMADKAQDKTIKMLPSSGITAITNTTNGSAQELRFVPDGASLTVVTPSSDGQTFVALPGSVTPVSLLANQAAYFQIDRNNPTTALIQVANLMSVPLEENVFILAIRINTQDIYIWDGSILPVGSSPPSSFLTTIVQQNQTMKLIGGGVWAWDLGSETLSWDNSAFVQIASLEDAFNEIPTDSVVIGAGEAAWVSVNRAGPGGTLPITVDLIENIALGADVIIIARRDIDDVIVGNHSMRLIDGESKALYAGISEQNLVFMGAADAADSQPNYSGPHRNILNGNSLVNTIASLDTELDKFFGQLQIKAEAPASQRAIITGVDYSMFDGRGITQEIANLLMRFDGAIINFATGVITDSLNAPLGQNFTPVVPASGQFRWFSISAIPSSTDSTNRMGIQLVVKAAAADGASSAAAPRAAFAGPKKLGQLFLQGTGGGNFANIQQANIQQLGVGSGGGGDNVYKVLGGGVFTHNPGSVTQNMVASLASDTGNFQGSSNPNNVVAVRILTPAGTLHSLRLDLQRIGGGTGNVYLEAIDQSAPNPAGSVIATSNVVDVTTISSSPGTLTEFVFPTLPTLISSSTNFRVRVTSTASVRLNYGSTFVGGGLWISGDGGATFSSNLIGNYGFELYYQVATDPQLEFSTDMFLERAGLANAENTILQSESPILFPNDGDVAWVQPNLSAGGPSLTVTVSAPEDVASGGVIIARREGTDYVVGTSSTRLIPGESKALYAGVSNELLSVIPASNNADRTGQLRLLANDLAPVRVDVSAVSKIVPDGTEYGIQLKNLLLDFAGAQIDFETGDIYEEDGITPLGINFTPATIAAGQYRWYSVTLVPATVTGANQITGQLVVIPADADGASAAAAPRAAFASSGIKIGQVVVQESGGGIADIAQDNIVQMGTGGSGAGGEGDANELLERLKDRLINSPFEWAEPNIFLMDEDDKIDTATASFDVANTLYKFQTGQNIVSTNSLDPEFLTEGTDVNSVELLAYWNEGAIDSNATYEVSRNGGVDWETMTMERVGLTTDTFRGIFSFPADSSWITLHEWPVGNATAYRELNATTLQGIAQQFAVPANTEEVLQRVTLYINKVGSPVGATKVQIVRDDGAGAPSTDLLDILAEVQINNSTLSAGDNAVTLSIGSNLVAAEDYHYVIVTDAAYKAGFSSGVNSVRARVDSSAPIGPFGIDELVSGVWTPNAAQTLIYTIQGRPLDLRVRITASANDVELRGYGILYGREMPLNIGIKNREVQSFDGTVDNFNEFTLTNFLPDPDLLKVYHVETGQVYVRGTGSFVLDGHKVIFPVDTFDGLSTVTLVFDQPEGSAFDNSDSNAALLAANFLGSTDATIDRSIPGRGIFLRRPDGTLREITIDDSDNIVVYSV